MAGDKVTTRATLKWRGDQAKKEVVEQVVIPALDEFGLRWETLAKRGLKAGAGVLTGTYRRSLHSASPGYDFAADDIEPSKSSPERSGTGGGAEQDGSRVTIRMGSGIRYAPFVEKRYGTITAGLLTMVDRFESIVAKHAAKVFGKK